MHVAVVLGGAATDWMSTLQIRFAVDVEAALRVLIAADDRGLDRHAIYKEVWEGQPLAGAGTLSCVRLMFTLGITTR